MTGNIIIFSDSSQSSIYFYNFYSDSWVTVNYPVSLNGNSPIVINNYILLFFGKSSSNSFTSDIYIYNSKSNSWSTNNLIIYNYQLRLVGNNVIFFNGQSVTTKTFSNTVYTYNFNSNSWNTVKLSGIQYQTVGISNGNFLTFKTLFIIISFFFLIL